MGFGLVVVLRSEKDGVKVGDHMFGMTTFEAYCVQPYIEGIVCIDGTMHNLRTSRAYQVQSDRVACGYIQYGYAGAAGCSKPKRSVPLVQILQYTRNPWSQCFCRFRNLLRSKKGTSLTGIFTRLLNIDL